jgi:hypothetical protein
MIFLPSLPDSTRFEHLAPQMKCALFGEKHLGGERRTDACIRVRTRIRG